MRTSGENPISRIAAVTCATASSGRPCHSASSARRRLDGDDELDVRSALRQRAPAARRRSAASSNRPRAIASRPSSSCYEDLVDPERPDLLGAAERSLALVPAAEPVQVVAGVAQHVRAEEPHRAQSAPSIATPTQASVDGLLQPARRRRAPRPSSRMPRPMSSTTADLLGDRDERRAGPRMPPSMSPSDGRVDAPGVEGVALDRRGRPTAPRERPALRSARSATPRTCPPSIRICARPAIARARATDGGSGGISAIGGPVGLLRDLALAGDPGVSAQPLVEQAGPDRIRGLVDEPDRRLDVGDGAGRLVEPGDARPASRAGRPGRARPGSRRRGPGPTARGRARTGRAPRGRRSRRSAASPATDRGLERARQVVGGVPVVGELGRAGRSPAALASSVRAKAACSRVRSPGRRSS